MPTIDGKDTSPDEAILLGRCPECGQPLIPKTALAHASAHWFGRDPDDPWLSEEARRRYKLIIDFAADRYNPFAAPQKREEAAPDGNGMSIPPSDKPVKTFLDYVALGLILEAAAAFWRGENLGRVLAGLIGGAAVLGAHYRWDWLKETLGERFASTARNVATDFRWWLLPVLLLFIYVAGPTLITELRKPAAPASAPTTVETTSQPTPDTGPTAYRLGDQFASNLYHDFLSLPRPCVMKIMAPPDLQFVRDQLVGRAMNAFVPTTDGYGNWVIPPCSIVNEQEDRHPELYGHHDFPAVGMAIHTSDNNLKARKFLAELFRSQSIPVSGDSMLPPGSPENLIYIEIGQKLWK
jgi:hypothetical protein